MNSSTTQSEPIKVGPGGIYRPEPNESESINGGPGSIYRPKPVLQSNKTHYSIMSFLYFVIMLFALYLSFLCNNGFDIGGFLMALFFPYIYIIYKLATVKDFCGLNKMI
jgi:hypothetical protein